MSFSIKGRIVDKTSKSLLEALDKLGGRASAKQIAKEADLDCKKACTHLGRLMWEGLVRREVWHKTDDSQHVYRSVEKSG